mgnify:CR=1 FL=1
MKTVVCTWASAAFALAAAAKTPVTPPTLEDKPYTGERQTATVPAGNWTVMPYSGWTAAGTYSVSLVLDDPDAYEWEAVDGVTVDAELAIVPFRITKAANEWTVPPAMAGWEWGTVAPTPVAASRFGQPQVTYSGTKADGTAVAGATSVTGPGDYTARFTVAETPDYAGLEADVPFSVSPGRIEIDPSDPSESRLVVRGYEGVYDGAGHAITVQVAGTGTEPFTVGYALDEAGPYTGENPVFTNVCGQTVWFLVECAGYVPYTNCARVAIAPRDIANAAVAPIAPAVYAGVPVEPVPEVVDGTPSIITADDYDVSYSGNDAPGTATLTLTGRRNYTGTLTAAFAIGAPPVSAAELAAEIDWKPLKATGTYFARLTVTCTNGLAAGIDDLRFLFADRIGADGTVEACLWDSRRRAARAETEAHGGETYRAVALDTSRLAAEGVPAVFGVADLSARTIPVAERTVEMYVRRRVVPQGGNEGAAEVGDFVGYVAWSSGGGTFAVPVVAGASALSAPLRALRATGEPLSRRALNASLAVGVPLAEGAVPSCRLAAFSVDGETVSGRVEVGAAVGCEERTGALGANARVTLLGARSPGGPFVEVAAVDVAADGTFSVAKPEGAAFFKVRVEVVDVVK